MKYSKYVKLGVLIVITLTILIWGLSYLKGKDVFQKSNNYFVVYDRIDGLQESNKITMNGYQVGQVYDIKLLPDNSGRLVVTLMMDQNFNIPVNSVAQIISSDIMGTRTIKMVFSQEKTFYQSGDTIPGAIESDLKEQVSMQVLPLKNKAEQLLGTVDSAIVALTVILNEDARKNLSQSFANINRSIDNIEKTTSDLQQIVSAQKGNIQLTMENVRDITSVLSKNSKELENTIKNMSSFSDTLSRLPITPVVENIALASEQLLDLINKMNSTENTAGLLLNDDKLYRSITELSENLSTLIKDIQTNPKRYLEFSAIDFGKEYYINTSGDVSDKNVVFKVLLVSSENQVATTSKYFEGLGEIEEYQANGAYSYLTGNTSIYSEIVKIQDQAKKKFPEATIVAFKNGKLIKIEKVLKSGR
jgi:phospholipid/cholesterol/gamma-HCH transport system substrate-binding protein